MTHRFTGRPTKATATKVATIAEDRLPGRPEPKFIYAHHPSGWTYTDGVGFLPTLAKIPIRPGVNGCKAGPSGHLPMLNRLSSEGWIPIDESGPVKITDRRTGKIADAEGYLMRWPGRRGAIYQDVWAEPTIIGAGSYAECDWSTQYDRAGFQAWQVWLRDSGAVPAIQAGVAAQLVKVKTRRAARRVTEGHDGNPHVQALVVAEAAELASMEDAAIDIGARVRRRRPVAAAVADGDPVKKRGPGRPRKAQV